jgi:hypothetical protein
MLIICINVGLSVTSFGSSLNQLSDHASSFSSLWSSSSHPQDPFCPIRLEERRKTRSKSWTRFSSPLWHLSSPILDPQPASRSSPPQHPTLPGSGSSYQALAHRSLSQNSRDRGSLDGKEAGVIAPVTTPLDLPLSPLSNPSEPPSLYSS